MYLFKFFIYLYFCKSIFSFSNSYGQCKNHNSYIFSIKENMRLPSLIEVFPEIKYFLNIFKTKKNNCKTDDDCLFPLKCCDNPMDKYNKICCSGIGQKISVQENMLLYDKSQERLFVHGFIGSIED